MADLNDRNLVLLNLRKIFSSYLKESNTYDTQVAAFDKMLPLLNRVISKSINSYTIILNVFKKIFVYL